MQEANNLTGQHSQKFSGVVNRKAVGITADPKRGVILSLKTKKSNQPKNAFTAVVLNKGARPTLAAIKGALVNGNKPDYRADLTKVLSLFVIYLLCFCFLMFFLVKTNITTCV